MREYLLVLVIAVAVTYLASGLCRRLAFRIGALARVRDRDVHTVEMPYFGGIAMFAGVAAAMLLSVSLPFLGSEPTVREDSRAVLIAAGVICLVGVLDDVYELPPLAKFAGQVLAAGIAVALGVKMLWIPLPGQILSLNASASVAITVFFIVLCSNAVNFVDGLDGLATGVVGIGAGAFFAYSYLLAVVRGPDPGDHGQPDHRGHRGRLSSASCRTTSSRPGCSWATRGRCCSGCCWPPPRSA